MIRIKQLILLLAVFLFSGLGCVSVHADEYPLDEYPVKGNQVEVTNVKAGQIYAFNSAMYNYTKTNPQQDVPNLWLCGRTFQSSWAGAPTLAVLTGLTEDNLFVLEEAPDQVVGETTWPSFYLKHVADGQYVCCTGDGSTKGISALGPKENATSFSFQDLSAYPAAGSSEQYHEYMNELTLCTVHYDENGEPLWLGPAWNYGFSQYSRAANDCIVWNLFEVSYSNSAKANLEHWAAIVGEVVSDFATGTTPGCYDQDLVEKLGGTYANAVGALELGLTEDEYLSYYNELRTDYDAVLASQVPLTDGYYNILNAYPEYEKIQGVKKAMAGSTEENLVWGNYDSEDGFQLFKITKLESGNYSVYNVGTNMYVGSIAGQSQVIPLTKEQTVEQTITLIGQTGQWNIANVDNAMTYHTKGHLSGVGASGPIVTWDGGVNTPSAWYLQPVTDEALVQKLVEEAPKKAAAQAVSNYIAEAQAVRALTIDFDSLVHKASQFSANSMSAGDSGSFEHLIDGNTHHTHNFHSRWAGAEMSDYNTTEDTWAQTQKDFAAANPDNIAIGIGYHDLQVALDEPVSSFYFRYIGRTGTTWIDNPTEIEVFATNDDALGSTPDMADIDQWDEIIDLTEGFPDATPGAVYKSPTIKMGKEYKYIRFVIKKTALEGSSSNPRTFVQPEITGKTWNVGEFQLYSVNGNTTTSEYYTVAGMKEACDALDALVDADQEKVNSLTAEMSDTTALAAAIKAVKDLYIDRSVFDAQMAEALVAANNAYSQAKGGSSTALITNVTDGDEKCQVSSIYKMPDVGTTNWGRYAYLLDGDPNTFFFTQHDASVQQCPDGLHNIIVDLQEQKVNDFYFYFEPNPQWMVYGFEWKDVDVYGSNDQENWTKLTSITDIPDKQNYTSPMIHMDEAYRYIRYDAVSTYRKLVVNQGECFCLGEFQMYTGADPQTVQYNYNPEVKKAADALKALITEDEALEMNRMLDDSKVVALKEATKNLLDLLVDTTEWSKYYKIYNELVDNSSVGTELGYVDEQSSIDNFAAALATAKTNVDPVQPVKAKVDAALESIKAAYNTFFTHVKQVDPTKWYTIITGSTREYAIDQPVFLGSTNTGCVLSLGGYPIESQTAASDPYAVWRFVPVEGKVGQYYIQSLGTGQYFGPYRGQGSDASPLMSHEKTPYNMYAYGNGAFKLQQDGVDDIMNCLKADQSTNTVLNWPANGDHQQSWHFEEVTEDILSFNWIPYNSIQITTLPFDATDDLSLMALNEGEVKTYGIKNITSNDEGTTLELTLQNDIKAGEPFVLEIGDYSAYDAANVTYLPIIVSLPETVVDEAATVNGLVGTLTGETITKPGMGIFTNSKLAATTGSTSINGRFGYINPNLVTTQDGTTDLVITTTDKVTGINKVVNKASDIVNVYTIDGKLVKKNVNAIQAKKNLKKGIYIIGKKKVAVK